MIDPIATAIAAALRPMIVDAVRDALAAATPPPPAHAWLTVAEAADVLRVVDRTVRRMIAAGEITASRTSAGGSSRVRVSRASVDAYLAAGRRP